MISKTMTEQKEKPQKKYRNTKQLIRLAIENGYTNKDIADKAGFSSEGQVSKWRNGKALATERQVQFFINEFEHLLKRKMEHLFYSESENQHEFTYHKIEGEIVLTHTLNYRRYNPQPMQKTGLFRIIIVNSGNKFHLIKQKKVGLNNDGSNFRDLLNKKNAHSVQEANWLLVETIKNLEPQQLIDKIDSIESTYRNSEEYIDKLVHHDTIPLKFIVRQLLLKRGYCSNDIIDL